MKKQNEWADAYKDSRWQKKRLEIMERDEWTCRSCGAKGPGVTLNVHHAYYESGKKPWEYPVQTLVTWCEKCHKKRHYAQKVILSDLIWLSLPALDGAVMLCRNGIKTLEAVSSSPLFTDNATSIAVNACMHAYDEGLSDGREEGLE